jgi:hypothetical protein
VAVEARVGSNLNRTIVIPPTKSKPPRASFNELQRYRDLALQFK